MIKISANLTCSSRHFSQVLTLARLTGSNSFHAETLGPLSYISGNILHLVLITPVDPRLPHTHCIAFSSSSVNCFIELICSQLIRLLFFSFLAASQRTYIDLSAVISLFTVLIVDDHSYIWGSDTDFSTLHRSLSRYGSFFEPPSIKVP